MVHNNLGFQNVLKKTEADHISRWASKYPKKKRPIIQKRVKRQTGVEPWRLLTAKQATNNKHF